MVALPWTRLLVPRTVLFRMYAKYIGCLIDAQLLREKVERERGSCNTPEVLHGKHKLTSAIGGSRTRAGAVSRCELENEA